LFSLLWNPQADYRIIQIPAILTGHCLNPEIAPMVSSAGHNHPVTTFWTFKPVWSAHVAVGTIAEGTISEKPPNQPKVEELRGANASETMSGAQIPNHRKRMLENGEGPGVRGAK